MSDWFVGAAATSSVFRCASRASLAGALLVLAGCADPFQPRASDYGTLTPIERLRLIDPSNLPKYAKPELATPLDAMDQASIQAARTRFEGLDKVLHHTWKMAKPGPARVAFGPPLVLTGDDYDLFLEAYEEGDPKADYNDDDSVTGDDLDDYLYDYNEGC